MKTCRHCGREKVNRPRGLCWTCYYAPGMLELYPVTTSKFNSRGVGNGRHDRPLPTPTLTHPGSHRKFTILCLRAALGQQLFHPLDRRFPIAERTCGHSGPGSSGVTAKHVRRHHESRRKK